MESKPDSILTETARYYSAKITEHGDSPQGVDWNGIVRTVPERLAKPLSWRKPRKVFVNSMSDLFHEGVSDEFIRAVWRVAGGRGRAAGSSGRRARSRWSRAR